MSEPRRAPRRQPRRRPTSIDAAPDAAVSPVEAPASADRPAKAPETVSGAALLPAAPLPIGRETAFRATGDVAFATWEREFARVDSPIEGDVLRAMYDAAAGVSGMVLERLRVETTYGANVSTARNNVLGLRDRTGKTLSFEAFPSPVDCVKEVIRRWTDPTYKPSHPGVYMPRDLSIAGMLERYSPPDENDTEALIAATVDHLNAWRAESEGKPAPKPAPRPEYVFGMPAWPKGLERRILDLAPAGKGWDPLGDRSQSMCLIVGHHTAGHDDRDGVYNLFSRGGGRWGQAATDMTIDRRGLGYLMLDPWSADPDEGSGITPWASGPAESLKGIGVPIVQQLGANAINKRGLSAEHSNVDGEGFTDPQMDLSAKCYAVGITRMRIPWDTFPVNPNVGGLRIDAVHDRFAPTSCPGIDWPWGGGVHTAWVQAIAHEAKILQTGTAPPLPIPVPPPAPPSDPRRFTAFGLPLEQIEHYFGALTRYNLDGTTDQLGFNPEGVLSNFWLERFGKEGRFPEAEELRAFDSKLAEGREWFASWEGGYTAWLPIDNNRATWRWLDEPEAT